MAMLKCAVKACFVVFLVACLAERCTGASNAEKIFNVNQFGARPDGKIDNSKAFLAAWKAACGWNGKTARIVIPKGIYLTGPVTFEGPCVSRMVFLVAGVVKAVTDLSQYPTDNWIVFEYLSGLLITGGGVFDGQGKYAWPHNNCQVNTACKMLPTSIKLNFVTNSTVRSISSIDSKSFHIHLFECTDMSFHHMMISAPADSPNTDGINIGASRNIQITNSLIGTGDDCIAIQHGCSEIHISNVLCGPGHGISVGSLGKYPNEENVHTLSVKNCSFSNTDNGVRIKTWANSKSAISVSHFTFDGIFMRNVRNPIIIDQEYCPYKSCPHEPPSSVKISDVSFKDIAGTSATQVAINLLCSDRYPCENIILENINLRPSVQGASVTASCTNVRGSSRGIQHPASCV